MSCRGLNRRMFPDGAVTDPCCRRPLRMEGYGRLEGPHFSRVGGATNQIYSFSYSLLTPPCHLQACSLTAASAPVGLLDLKWGFVNQLRFKVSKWHQHWSIVEMVSVPSD